jgi:hypothetical protein
MAFFFLSEEAQFEPASIAIGENNLARPARSPRGDIIAYTPEGRIVDVGATNLGGLRGTPNDADDSDRAVDATIRDGRQDFRGCSMESSGAWSRSIARP